MSRRSKIGLAPGTLIHVGVRHADQATMAGMRFAPQGALEARSLPDAAAAAAFATADQVAWVDVNGVHDVELVRQLGTGFGLHPLLMEDLVNTTQRPKAEDYGDRYYLVVPTNGVSEGSYGVDSNDDERPQSANACLPREIGTCPDL